MSLIQLNFSLKEKMTQKRENDPKKINKKITKQTKRKDPPPTPVCIKSGPSSYLS